MARNKIPASAITERQLRRMIKDASKKSSSLSAWAVEAGITPQQVTSFMRRIQSAGLKIPEYFGYRPQTVFLPLDEELIAHMNPPRRLAKNPSKKVDHTREPIEKKGLRPVNDRKETKQRLKDRKG